MKLISIKSTVCFLFWIVNMCGSGSQEQCSHLDLTILGMSNFSSLQVLKDYTVDRTEKLDNGLEAFFVRKNLMIELCKGCEAHGVIIGDSQTGLIKSYDIALTVVDIPRYERVMKSIAGYKSIEFVKIDNDSVDSTYNFQDDCIFKEINIQRNWTNPDLVEIRFNSWLR